jgi:hypothetical protein
MLYRKFFVKICLILLFLIPSFSLAKASTVSPYKRERMITNQERTRETVSFKNDGKKDIYVIPRIYSYNPQTLEITDTQGYIFVQADREIFKVKPEEVLVLNYEIVPPLNMEPGTYFNLIVFQTQSEDSFLNQTNPVGVIDNISHLVVLHIIEADNAVYGITTEFAQISLEVVERGIPFIRPTKVKYIYQNVTNYVLSPMGEIQVFNRKGKYAPIYLKINKEEEKLYPGGIIEEEFEVAKYDITDIYNQRVVIGRFYNGIDQNYILKETSIEPNYIVLVLGIILLLAVLILIKAIVNDSSKAKKKVVKPS